MPYKDEYEVLGVVVDIATNGLSVYKKGKSQGQISGGKQGDVVVRPKDADSFAAVSIIGEQEWEAMPQNEAAEAEMKQALDGAKNLAPELAKAKNEIERLKAEILEVKGEREHLKEEHASLQEQISAAADENITLTQKIAQLEAENKKQKEAAQKGAKDKTADAHKANEQQGLNLGGNE